MICTFLHRKGMPRIFALLLGVIIGLLARELTLPTRGDEDSKSKVDRARSQARAGAHLAPDTPAAYNADWERDYPQYQPVGKALKAMPSLKPGDICPQDLSGYGGAGRSSYGSIDDVADFEEFCRMCQENKPRVMEERRK